MADAEEASGGRRGVAQRAKAGLRAGVAGCAGEHHARQAEIGVVEHVAALAIKAQPETVAEEAHRVSRNTTAAAISPGSVRRRPSGMRRVIARRFSGGIGLG